MIDSKVTYKIVISKHYQPLNAVFFVIQCQVMS
ncbi:hypothetical protein SAMN04488601_101433 [Paenibacillus sp. 453mf]|nr:hypothetical protein SAMN04488601_101433 [Paenibacillus sp. 453mf]